MPVNSVVRARINGQIKVDAGVMKITKKLVLNWSLFYSLSYKRDKNIWQFSSAQVEAEAVLASIGLTVSDAFRMMMMRIAKEKTLPFEPFMPNDETIEAMRAAQRWFYRILWSCIFRCLWIEKWSRKRFREIFRGHFSHSGAWKFIDYLITYIAPTGRTTKSVRTSDIPAGR